MRMEDLFHRGELFAIVLFVLYFIFFKENRADELSQKSQDLVLFQVINTKANGGKVT